jgi:hypothetical protein
MGRRARLLLNEDAIARFPACSALALIGPAACDGAEEAEAEPDAGVAFAADLHGWAPIADRPPPGCRGGIATPRCVGGTLPRTPARA